MEQEAQSNFENNAALQFAYGNTDQEIEEILKTLGTQQMLSLYTFLEDLEDRRLSRINQIMTGRMGCIKKTVSNLTLGTLNRIPDTLEKYAEKLSEIRRIRSMMQKRVDSFLIVANASMWAQTHARMGK